MIGMDWQKGNIIFSADGAPMKITGRTYTWTAADVVAGQATIAMPYTISKLRGACATWTTGGGTTLGIGDIGSHSTLTAVLVNGVSLVIVDNAHVIGANDIITANLWEAMA